VRERTVYEKVGGIHPFVGKLPEMTKREGKRGVLDGVTEGKSSEGENHRPVGRGR